MSILSMADYAGSMKQVHRFAKTMSGPAIAWGSGWNDGSAGAEPAAAGSFTLSTPNGAVPTNLTTGAPNIQPFSGFGYVSRLEVSPVNAASATIHVFDRLFECGSYAWNSGLTTLTGQPSFSSRVPDGNYSGLKLLMEQGATTGSGPTSLTITYTDQSGNTGHSTTYTVKANGGVSAGGCIQQIALAAGDSGIQTVESVTTSGGASGNFNLLIVREIARVPHIGSFSMPNPPGFVLGLEQLGFRRVYQDSCLMVASSASISVSADFTLEIVSG